jgi:Tol biopolymer transport system component
MLRLAALAAVLSGLALAGPSGAQIGSGKIAYTSSDGLYTVNADGSGHALLKSGTGFSSPRWSPDGSRVAFVDFNGYLDWRLLVVNADGSNEHVLAIGNSEIALSRQPWSPDGSKIAWRGSFLVGNDVQTDLYTADAGGGGLRQLTFDGGQKDSPLWSPIGSMLVFARFLKIDDLGVNDLWELFVVAGDGSSGPRQITPSDDGTSTGDPTWSPSGDVIAFGWGRRGVGGIGFVHPDGTQLQRAEGQFPHEMTWSPDGSKIAGVGPIIATSRYTYGEEIYVVAVDGLKVRRLTEFGAQNAFDASPVWSPDGNRILFARTGALMTMNPDGTCQATVPGAVQGDSADVSSWQPVPGGPAVGTNRCHSLTVRGTITPTGHGTAALIRATLRNNGAEPLTDVRFVPPRSGDLTARTVETNRGQCSLRQDLVRCAIGTLAPGEEAQIVIRADGRRVIRDAGDALKMTLTGQAAEPSIEPWSNTFLVHTDLWRCTTQTPGGARIVVTRASLVICGRRGSDRIEARVGGGQIFAGAGNDLVLAKNGSDDVIWCGPGRDRVIADRIDVVDRSCERVSRR